MTLKVFGPTFGKFSKKGFRGRVVSIGVPDALTLRLNVLNDLLFGPVVAKSISTTHSDNHPFSSDKIVDHFDESVSSANSHLVNHVLINQFVESASPPIPPRSEMSVDSNALQNNTPHLGLGSPEDSDVADDLSLEDDPDLSDDDLDDDFDEDDDFSDSDQDDESIDEAIEDDFSADDVDDPANQNPSDPPADVAGIIQSAIASAGSPELGYNPQISDVGLSGNYVASSAVASSASGSVASHLSSYTPSGSAQNTYSSQNRPSDVVMNNKPSLDSTSSDRDVVPDVLNRLPKMISPLNQFDSRAESVVTGSTQSPLAPNSSVPNAINSAADVGSGSKSYVAPSASSLIAQPSRPMASFVKGGTTPASDQNVKNAMDDALARIIRNQQISSPVVGAQIAPSGSSSMPIDNPPSNAGLPADQVGANSVAAKPISSAPWQPLERFKQKSTTPSSSSDAASVPDLAMPSDGSLTGNSVDLNVSVSAVNAPAIASSVVVAGQDVPTTAPSSGYITPEEQAILNKYTRYSLPKSTDGAAA